MEGFGSPIKVVERPEEADILCAVDVAHAAKRALMAMGALATSDGRPSGHVFGVVQILIGFLRNQIPTGSKVCFVFCYEGTGAKDFRRQILPEYKSKRKPFAFDPMPDVTLTAARIPGVHLRVSTMEGDDCIAWACQHWSDKRVVILSSDRDLWALMRHPNVSVFSPDLDKRGKYVTPEDIEEKFFTKDPARIYLVKSLYGDTSDCISGIPRLPKKDFNPHINACPEPTVASFFEHIQGVKFTPKAQEKVDNNGRQIAERNFQVVTPHIVPDMQEHCLYQQSSDPIRTAFEIQLQKFECKSLIQYVPYFFGAAFYPNVGG
jgi:5'-3' exonuclease